jgi:hypothetical protein
MDFPSSDDVRSAEHKQEPGPEAGHEPRHEVVGIDAIASPQTPHSIAKVIELPPLQCEAFVSQRHEVNPALALKLLQEIQASVSLWQQQQRQIVQAMQGLYAQGPMVDGWLQSSLLMTTPQPPSAKAGATVLRHGDPEALMKYVEALESSAIDPTGIDPSSIDSTEINSTETDTQNADISQQRWDNPSDTSTQYQLCSLQGDGSIRTQLCPPEQMALVSTAIARYQKFKQLMLQKQAIEAKLQQAVDLLSGVRHQLQQN